MIPALSELIGGLSLVREIPQIEVSSGDEDVALVLRVLAEPTAADLDQLRAFARTFEVSVFVQPGGLDSVALVEPAGAEHLRYTVPEFDVELEFRPTDFVQINAAVNRAMIARVLELLAPGPGDRVLDLFCGLGNFSLPLARRAGSVVGVEGEPALVERARLNAANNGLANAEFERRDLYGELGELEWAAGFDRVLIDPPRSGAAALVERFDAIAAPRVVYVACSTESLARDAATLVADHGYRLRAAGIADMFPHTAHVESIALFER